MKANFATILRYDEWQREQNVLFSPGTKVYVMYPALARMMAEIVEMMQVNRVSSNLKFTKKQLDLRRPT